MHPPLSVGGGGGGGGGGGVGVGGWSSYKPFKKRGGGDLTGTQLWEGVAGKEEVTFFRGEGGAISQK